MRVYTASPGRYTNTGRRAVFLSPCSSLCSSWLLAGPDAWHHGRYCSGLLHARRRPWQWHVQVWFCWFACRCPSRCASIGSQALNAPHYGRYGPEGQLPEVYRCVSVFSAMLGSTADTCDASACEDFWKNFSLFPPVRWIRFPRSAMSCGGDSFSPFGAYVFAWDSVKP